MPVPVTGPVLVLVPVPVPVLVLEPAPVEQRGPGPVRISACVMCVGICS